MFILGARVCPRPLIVSEMPCSCVRAAAYVVAHLRTGWHHHRSRTLRVSVAVAPSFLCLVL